MLSQVDIKASHDLILTQNQASFLNARLNNERLQILQGELVAAQCDGLLLVLDVVC